MNGTPDSAKECNACNNCGDHSHKMPEQQEEGCLEGWPLALSAACVFGLPAAGALGGAVAGGSNPDSMLLFGIGGMLVGAMIARVVSVFTRDFRKGVGE